MTDIKAATLLHRFLEWERDTPDKVYLTQPFPDGRVQDYSWAEVGNQARRMAAYLQSLQLAPHSNIALIGKNSAHWIIADIAIMMAGHVSVPLYPNSSQLTRPCHRHRSCTTAQFHPDLGRGLCCRCGHSDFSAGFQRDRNKGQWLRNQGSLTMLA